ncbi:hypothetical protein AB0L57_14740 [Nocardia sp. NPDC052254]|uniref:hypothetical protein n=1 Tax=Nocardia sp. NPDC052254 TaxID=3155681 RepID=UPI003448FB6C
MDNRTGVNVGGDLHVEGGSAVGGRDAVVTTTTGTESAATPATLEDLRRIIAELADAVRAAGELPERDTVSDAVEHVRAEAAKDKPNRHVLTGILAEIGSALTGVGNLARTVTAVQEAVRAVFS